MTEPEPAARLTGRTAVVTGGARGIGRGIALSLAGAGADVVVGDLDGAADPLDAEERERVDGAGGSIDVRRADVTDDADVDRLVGAAADRFGGLDVLVNNAGVTHDGTIEETSEAEWHRVMDVNLTGVYRCTRRAIPLLRESEAPRVVNVASQLGLVARPRRPAYCASKGGVVNLTRQLALDYADVPILVNAICPGVVRTPMTEPLFADADVRASLDAQTPLPYFGEPEDVGAMAAFLASDAARFVTGQTLVVDGGYLAR